MKSCITCNQTKNESQFFQSKEGYIHSYCKSCEGKRPGEYVRSQKLKAIEYKGGCCKDCFGSYLPAVFHFHHRDPHTKEFGFNHHKAWVRLEAELDKCDLLCANCHIIRHANERLAA